MKSLDHLGLGEFSPPGRPFGMDFVGSARSADRFAPAMMPVTDGK